MLLMQATIAATKIYKHIALLYCGTARIDKTHSDCFIRVFQLFAATNQ